MTNPLYEFRQSKGLQLNEAAKLCGVHSSTYLRWERGEINVSIENLDHVAKVTGVPKGDLRCLTIGGE